MTQKSKLSECPENLIRFFPEYLRIFGAINIRGGCTRWAQPTWAHQHPLAHPGGLWSPRGPLTYLFIPHHHLPPEKNPHCSLSRVLELKPADFDLFAQSSIHKTTLGDCSSICDSSNGPISFCFSGLYFE